MVLEEPGVIFLELRKFFLLLFETLTRYSKLGLYFGLKVILIRFSFRGESNNFM